MVVCVKSSLLLQLAFGLLCRYSSLLPRMHLRGKEEGEGEEGEKVLGGGGEGGEERRG